MTTTAIASCAKLSQFMQRLSTSDALEQHLGAAIYSSVAVLIQRSAARERMIRWFRNSSFSWAARKGTSSPRALALVVG